MEGLETELQCLLEGKSVDEGPIDISGRGEFRAGSITFPSQKQ